MKRSAISEKSWNTFSKRVGPVLPSGCREWSGCFFDDGYGAFCTLVDGVRKTLRAHRLSFANVNGEVPDDLLVLHSCDNPKCVEASHLFSGTWQDNSDDMRKKNRAKYPGSPRLTDQEVAQIRADPRTQRVIAAQFGCSQGHVSDIKKGKYRAASN